MTREEKKLKLSIKEDEIFISGNVPSSKNSKQIARTKTKTGTRVFIRSSNTVKNYIDCHMYEWQSFSNKKKFKKMIEGKKKPYKIAFYFIRDTKRKFDLINAAQLPLDLMQKAGWIEDDDASTVLPVFLGYKVDKENAGLIIKVL